jgi:hypothetical protein
MRAPSLKRLVIERGLVPRSCCLSSLVVVVVVVVVVGCHSDGTVLS